MRPKDMHLSDWMRSSSTRTESGCLLWPYQKKRRYGHIRVNGERPAVHRLMYEMVHGPIPVGKVIIHSCDQTKCIEPNHLILGTQTENIADMDAKGRRCRGQWSPNAKLTDLQVADIRASKRSNQELAELYLVDSSYISRLRSMKRRAYASH